MKYLVLYWDAYGETNSGEECRAVWTWKTNKREAEQEYRRCAEMNQVCKLVEVKTVREQTACQLEDE